MLQFTYESCYHSCWHQEWNVQIKVATLIKVSVLLWHVRNKIDNLHDLPELCSGCTKKELDPKPTPPKLKPKTEEIQNQNQNY